MQLVRVNEFNHSPIFISDKRCPVEPATMNATIQTNGTHVEFQSNAEYSCDIGFMVEAGDETRLCIEGNKLAGEALVCVAGW